MAVATGLASIYRFGGGSAFQGGSAQGEVTSAFDRDAEDEDEGQLAPVKGQRAKAKAPTEGTDH